MVDIMFPTLPRWFTAPLRVRTRRATSVHYPNGTQRPVIPSPPPTPPENVPPHDHALLESLYQSVFESRFINLRPTGEEPMWRFIVNAWLMISPSQRFSRSTLQHISGK